VPVERTPRRLTRFVAPILLAMVWSLLKNGQVTRRSVTVHTVQPDEGPGATCSRPSFLSSA
jgi:hypothetical protein